jgi:hypothetical protein
MKFDSIKKHFPIKTDNIEDFIDIIKQEEADKVRGGVWVKRKLDWQTVPTSCYLYNHYSVRLLAQTTIEREIRYDKPFYKVPSSRFFPRMSPKFTHLDELAKVQGLVMTKKRLEYIKQALPNVSTTLVNIYGPIDNEHLKELPELANKYGIKIE